MSSRQSNDHFPCIRSFSSFRMAIAARNRSPGQRPRSRCRRAWAVYSRRPISTGVGAKPGIGVSQIWDRMNTLCVKYTKVKYPRWMVAGFGEPAA